MIVAAHGRVSSEEQREGRTIETQKAEVTNLALLHGHEIIKTYWEDGISGATLNRPLMDQLREDAKAHLFQVVVTYHPDRLSRDQADQLVLLKEFDKLGIKVIFTTQPGVENLTGSSKIATRGINALTSELERQRILERTTNGRLNRARSGNVVTSRPPFGFTYVRRNRDTKTLGHFVHNPQEIEVVRLILSWAKEGWSQRQIIKELHNKKIPTRNEKTAWAKSTIQKILNTNLDFYVGRWYYLKYSMAEPKTRLNQSRYRKDKTSRILKDRSEWIEVKLDPSLAVITQEEYETIRRNQRLNSTFTEGNTKNFYLLSKMVYCKHCQQPDYSDSYHGVAYYRCADRRRHFPNPPTCQGGSIKAETLEGVVWDSVVEAISNPSFLKSQAERYIQTQKDDGVLRSSELEEIQRHRQQLERERERMVAAYREEAITLGELKRQRLLFETRQAQIDEQEKEVIANRKKAGLFNFELLQQNIDDVSREFKKEASLLLPEERRKILQWISLKVFTGDYQAEMSLKVPLCKTLVTTS